LPELGLAPEWLAILACVALVAGFVDAIAGGGGLITVPALLMAGVPPVQAIATNKLQGTFGVLSSTITFWRAGALDRRAILPFGSAALAGGVLGALVATRVPVEWLRLAIPFILMAIAFYMLVSPKFGDSDARQRLSPLFFAMSFGLSIGLYDGAFGPGAGTFYLIGLVTLCGFPLVKAVAHTKLMNAASNLGALMFFLAAGQVLIIPGLIMGIAAAFGAWMGARTTLHRGAGLIRPLVIGVALAMALRLMLDQHHPVGAFLARVF
jgi:hypothetical protein